MNKIVRFLGQKKESRARATVLACAFGFLLMGIIQFEFAHFALDYTEVPAYITDVSGRKRLQRFGSTTEYTYTVHYFYNGNEYSMQQRSGDRPGRDISTAWVAEDNSDVTIYSPHSMDVTAMIILLLGFALFALWVVLYKRAELTNYSNMKIASDVAIVSFIIVAGSAFSVVVLIYCYFNLSSNAANKLMHLTLLLFSGLLFMSSLIIGSIALMEYKKYNKIYEEKMLTQFRKKNYDMPDWRYNDH